MAKLAEFVKQHSVGIVALVVALSGTAYAAATVGSPEIQNNSIKSKDIRDNAVKPGDLASSAQTFTVVQDEQNETTQPGLTHPLVADCPSGSVVTGGGAQTDVTDLSLVASYPGGAPGGGESTQWTAIYKNASSYTGPVSLTAWAVCAE